CPECSGARTGRASPPRVRESSPAPRRCGAQGFAQRPGAAGAAAPDLLRPAPAAGVSSCLPPAARRSPELVRARDARRRPRRTDRSAAAEATRLVLSPGRPCPDDDPSPPHFRPIPTAEPSNNRMRERCLRTAFVPFSGRARTAFMKLATVVLAALTLGAWPLVVQSPAGRPAPDLSEAFPAGQQRPDQFALTADGRRTYFVDGAGDAWLYDRATKTKTRCISGPLWDLALSPAGNAIAYTKGGDRRGDQHVWVVDLAPASGQARGVERRVSPHQGDVPSISPDGTLVAFARDDETGVGQSVVVVPLAGGSERVVAA